MHKALRARNHFVPSLPPKRSTATQDEAFAEKRRAELDIYIADLISDLQVSAAPRGGGHSWVVAILGWLPY